MRNGGRSLGERLPVSLSIPLFGDRAKYGRTPAPGDPDWEAWQKFYMEFYMKMQKNGIGKIVNDAGYGILRRLPLAGTSIFELGPGTIPHCGFWRGTPDSYIIADVSEEMLEASSRRLAELKIPSIKTLILPRDGNGSLQVPDGTCDTVLTFYSLEHLNPLDAHLDELFRILKPGGALVGGHTTEGGMAWGIGRWLTSRRFLINEGRLNPDKVICWEHPNFASEILERLAARFDSQVEIFWPLRIRSIDLNLVIEFIMRKPK